MLFDLRGRGRRRTIQGIYLALAVLMGGGLVLFGIGGATSGGLVDAIKGNGGGSGSGSIESKLKAAEKRTARAPGDAAAWAQVAHLRFQLAGLGGNYDQTQGSFTPQARPDLTKAKQAWDQYLAVVHGTPDANLANEMVQIFGGPGGLGDYAAAARAQEIVAGSQATFTAFRNLALFSYLARQVRKGDLAAARAESLAPPAQRAVLKQQLAQAKAQAAKQAPGAPGAPTPPPTG